MSAVVFAWTANAVARRTEARVCRFMVAVCGRGVAHKIENVKTKGVIALRVESLK